MLLLSVWRGGDFSFLKQVILTVVFPSRVALPQNYCVLFQGATIIRRFSGSENTIPLAGKDELPKHMGNIPSKQEFAIYVDDQEQKENYSYQVAEELESSLCELDTSAMSSSVHLLLDLSTGNTCYY